jgi:hypothetical protein
MERRRKVKIIKGCDGIQWLIYTNILKISYLTKVTIILCLIVWTCTLWRRTFTSSAPVWRCERNPARARTQNILADTLSPIFERQIHHEPQISCHAVLSHFPLVFQDLAAVQRQDPELSVIISKLENKEPDSKYSLTKGVLYCRARFDRKR